MLYLMSGNTTILWICIIIAAILVTGSLAYVYYRIKIKSEFVDAQPDEAKSGDRCGCENKTDAGIKSEENKQQDIVDTSFTKTEKTAETAQPAEAAENITASAAIESLSQGENPKENKNAPAGVDMQWGMSESASEKAVQNTSDNIEILYENALGKIDIVGAESGGIKFRLFYGGILAGESDTYQTRSGILKGIKSLANYKDAGICEAGDTGVESLSRFEICRDENGKYGYSLKTKIKTKFTGTGFYRLQYKLSHYLKIMPLGFLILS